VDGGVEPLPRRRDLEAEQVFRSGSPAGTRQDIPYHLDRIGADKGAELDPQQILGRSAQQCFGRSRSLQDPEVFRMKDHQNAVRLNGAGDFDRFPITVRQVRRAEQWVRYDHSPAPEYDLRMGNP